MTPHYFEINLENAEFIIEIIIDASRAIPNPLIINTSPKSDSVNIKINAFITNKNNPSVKTVAGNVKNMRIGLTVKFKSEITILANNAVLKFAI